jgi:hypothetical protein
MGSDKHTSLLSLSVINEEKSFITSTPVRRIVEPPEPVGHFPRRLRLRRRLLRRLLAAGDG